MNTPFSKNISWGWILGIAALCLLSRLPQLLSPYLHADYNGDECVLGLMAKHIIEGREFPFYFWGQGYGFSWIEAGAIAVAIKFFGMTVLSIKIPMLLLWTLGCVFFYAALVFWTSPIYSFGITSLLIFSPAWMSWSMRARGGYITAFLLSSMVLFLLSYNWQTLNKRILFCIGALVGFILYSQPLYLFGLLPLLVTALIKHKDFKKVFVLITGFILVFILGKVMAIIQVNTSYWKPVWFMPNLFISFAKSFGGLTFNALNQDSGKFWAAVLLSNIWFTLIGVCFVMYLWGLIIKQVSAVSTSFFISVALMLGSILIVDCEPRYFLSLSVFLILWFGVLFFELFNQTKIQKSMQWIVISILIVLGMLTAWNYKDFYRITPLQKNEIPEMQKINKVIKYLLDSDVKYVFSLDDDLSWKIMYFSNEHIISRWARNSGRQQAYINAIDQALLEGKKVAVAGNIIDEMFAYLIVEGAGNAPIVADPYFVYINPSRDLIENKLRFQLN